MSSGEVMQHEMETVDDILEGDFNRLDERAVPVDQRDVDYIEGELLQKTAGAAERLLGIQLDRYVDSMTWGELSEGTLANTRYSEPRVDIDDHVDRDETDLTFDPQYSMLDDQGRLGGMIHEVVHTADFQDELTTLLREIGFSPEQTYELANYAQINEDRREAVTEFTSRVANNLRDQIIYGGGNQTQGLQAYEKEVRELVNYLHETGNLPELERVMAIKNDPEFGSEQDIEFTDYSQDHYIETGSYFDEEGVEKSYALIVGDNEDTELFEDNMNEDLYDEIITQDIEEYFGNEGGGYDDGGDGDGGGSPTTELDPIKNYDFEEDTDYTLAQGPTAELYSPEVVIGAEPGNQPAADEPVKAGVAESEYAEAGV